MVDGLILYCPMVRMETHPQSHSQSHTHPRRLYWIIHPHPHQPHPHLNHLHPHLHQPYPHLYQPNPIQCLLSRGDGGAGAPIVRRETKWNVLNDYKPGNNVMCRRMQEGLAGRASIQRYEGIVKSVTVPSGSLNRESSRRIRRVCCHVLFSDGNCQTLDSIHCTRTE